MTYMHDASAFVQQDIEAVVQLADRKNALITSLFLSQRGYNFDKGTDLDSSYEDDPACQGGFINNLISSLAGLHSYVKTIFVNNTTLSLKAMHLVGALFDTQDYTKDEVREIQESLEDKYLLTEVAQSRLKPKVNNALHNEFDPYLYFFPINCRMTVIEESTIRALRFTGGDSSTSSAKS